MAKDNRAECVGDFFEAMAEVLGAAAIMTKAIGNASREYGKLQKEMERDLENIRVINTRVSVKPKGE